MDRGITVTNEHLIQSRAKARVYVLQWNSLDTLTVRYGPLLPLSPKEFLEVIKSKH